MHIVIVEDDPIQAGLIRDALHEAFPHVDLQHVSTESEFRLSLEGLAAVPPAVIVLDVMLRWADPAPDMPPRPPDVAHEGFSRAGLRCQRLLVEHPKLRKVPVILYTVLDRNSVEHGSGAAPTPARYLQKGSDLGPLVEDVRRVIKAPRATPGGV